MSNAFKNWLGPIVGTAIVTSVAVALVGSALASDDRREMSSRDGSAPADTSATTAPWLDMNELVSRLQAQGYRDVRDIERENGRYEVEGKNADGRSVELYVDSRTGGVLRSELED